MGKYRQCVGVILLNSEKKIFLGERRDAAEAWQLPQGGIDQGEDVIEAAKRELFEETSVKSVEVVYVTKKHYSYEVPANFKPKSWSRDTVGQQQKWVIMKFLGADTEININTKHPEFSRWKWGNFVNIVESSIDFKRELYKQLVIDLQPIIAAL